MHEVSARAMPFLNTFGHFLTPNFQIRILFGGWSHSRIALKLLKYTLSYSCYTHALPFYSISCLWKDKERVNLQLIIRPHFTFDIHISSD